MLIPSWAAAWAMVSIRPVRLLVEDGQGAQPAALHEAESHLAFHWRGVQQGQRSPLYSCIRVSEYALSNLLAQDGSGAEQLP